MPYADAVCPSRAGSADYNAVAHPPLLAHERSVGNEIRETTRSGECVKFRTRERTQNQVPYEDAVRPSRAGFAVLYVIAPLVWHSHNHDILGPKKIFSPDLCPKSIPVES